MATTSKNRGQANEAPRASIPPSVLSHRNKVAAARLRVTVNKKLGVDTPRWIRELAQTKAS